MNCISSLKIPDKETDYSAPKKPKPKPDKNKVK